MNRLPSIAVSSLLLLFSLRAAAQDQPPPLPPPQPPPPASTGTPTSPPPDGTQPPVQPAQPAAQPPQARPAPTEYKAEEHPEGAPPASTGFQMAIRTGPMFPMGTVGKSTGGKDVSMGDVYGWQIPIIIELGGKPIPNLFIGGYLGLGFGGASGDTATACDRLKVTCAAASFRIGVEIQYHIMPAEKMNPWIGYGIGLESAAVAGEGNGNKVSNAVSGPEYAHLMGGLDFRLSKAIGVGPLVDFSIGTYTHQKIEANGRTVEGDIDSSARATHFWLLVGGRLVIFP